MEKLNKIHRKLIDVCKLIGALKPRPYLDITLKLNYQIEWQQSSNYKYTLLSSWPVFHELHALLFFLLCAFVDQLDHWPKLNWPMTMSESDNMIIHSTLIVTHWPALSVLLQVRNKKQQGWKNVLFQAM